MSLRGDKVTVSSGCSIVGVVGMLAAVRAIGRGEQGGLINHGPSVLVMVANLEVGNLILQIAVWRASMALSKVLP